MGQNDRAGLSGVRRAGARFSWSCAALLGLWLIATAAPAAAQVETAVSRAEAWLVAHQNGDGSFGAIPELAPRDSALAVTALLGGDPSSTALANGLVYLAGVPEENTHYRALRVQALARAHRGFLPLLDSIFSFRNSHGFGAFGEHESNLFDTALAVQALTLDEAKRALDILPLLDYLRASRNLDGGWGFLPGDPSQVYYTAEVLLALASLEELTIPSGELDAAAAFLVSKQTPAGGFGSILETALAYRALLARGYELPVSPVSYLLSQQHPDGSWNGDAFTTAHAILALRTQLPNLVITALTSNPANAPLGSTVTLSATVRNAGPVSAPASTLVVRAGAADGPERASAAAPALTAGQQATVQISVATAGDQGNLELFAVADGRSQIGELDETDNARSVKIGLRTRADLAAFASSFSLSPSKPQPGSSFTLRIDAQNLGETQAPGSQYRVSRIVAGAAVPVQTGNLGAVNPGSSTSIPVSLNLSEGEHTYEVVLDTGNAVPEESEENNRAELTFFVVDSTRPDFAARLSDLTITPERPAVGQSIAVKLDVWNFGTESGTARVELFDGDPEAGGISFYSANQTVNGNGNKVTVTASYTIKAGTFAVVAVVDRAGQVAELDESNNRAKRFVRDIPDPAVGFDNLEIAQAEPIAGDPVAATLTVHNGGTAAATNLLVEVFDGEPSAAATPVFSQRVDLPAGGNRALPFTWTAVAGLRRLVVVLDRQGEILERLEDNNRAEREIAVMRSGGPDLSVSSSDTSGLAHSATMLTAVGTVSVSIANTGDSAAGTPFVVRLFEDRDGDGRFSTGDQDLGSSMVTDLAGGDTAAVPVPVDATLQFHRPLLWAEVDAADAVAERREDDNRKPLFGDCESLPAGSLEPIDEEWYVPGIEVESAPVVVQLSDDNGDGRVDSRDIPDVVFHTEDSQGRLVLALSGLGGKKLWEFRSTSSFPLQGRLAHLAAADLDGDGISEIIAVQTDARLIALNNRGVYLWTSEAIESTGGDWTGGPAVGDLDGDGVPEIVVGRAVLSNTGKRLAIGTADVGRNRNYYGPFGLPYYFDAPHSIIADVDLDGRAEIVAGDTLYRLEKTAQGMYTLNVVWDNNVPDKLMVDGFSAVGNFDGDAQAEIVYVSSNQVMILHHDGRTLVQRKTIIPFNQFVRPTFWLGPPTIADLDKDGSLDILVAGDSQLVALDAGLNRKWHVDIEDYAGENAATVFDLDGQGAREVIYLDENFLYIIDGASGEVLHKRPNTSKTGNEYPVVADVDNDGQAEILVPSNRHRDGDASTQGLHVLGNPAWTGARPIWNQYSYHVTNVQLDGTVPAVETPSWQLARSYRVNQELPRRPRRLPNLTLGLPRVGSETSEGVPVTLRVGNGGREALAPGVRIRLYDGETAAGEGVTAGALAPGQWEDVTVLWQAAGEAPRTALARVDPDAKADECDEGDNDLSFPMTSTVLPDLGIPANGVTGPATAVAGQLVSVSVQVKNAGAAASPVSVVRLYDGPPAAGVAAGETSVGPLNPGQTVTVVVRWDSIAALAAITETGPHALHALVDPDGQVPELDETNNQGLINLTLTAPTKPDLSLESLRLSATDVPAGEPVVITATVRNRGTALPNGFALALSVNNSREIKVDSVGDLDPGESRDVELTLATAGRSGVLAVEVAADPDNAIAEQDDLNNKAKADVRVTASSLKLALRTDRLSYQPGETVAFQVDATNIASNSASGPETAELRLRVVDSAGADIATVASQPVTLAPGATAFSFSWSVGSSLPGAYSAVAELVAGSSVRARSTSPFSIAREVDLQARLIADRDVYQPGQSAVLSGSITNRSANQILENLTATIAVAGASGELFSVARTVPLLPPGASLPVQGAWDVQTSPPGIYTASLSVRDAFGQLLAYGSTQLTVDDSSQSGSGLEGRLTASPATIGAGAPLALGFQITNRGNADLMALPLRLDVVRLADGVVVASLPQQRDLPRNGTVSGALGLPTGALLEGSYLVSLFALPAAGEVRLDSAGFTAARGVSVADVRIAEGDSGSTEVQFRVTLSSPVDVPVSVTYSTADGTASAPADYRAVSGTLTFAPGEVEKLVTVEVVGDVESESDEVFLLNLAQPVNAQLGDGQALAEIDDEEGCPGPNLLANPGAEDVSLGGELASWMPLGGAWTARPGDPAPLSGLASFAPLGSETELGQDVDLAPYASEIDTGGQRFAFGGFLHGSSARIVIDYRDADGLTLGSFDSGEIDSAGVWRVAADVRPAPVGTRSARVRLIAALGDAYFDRLSLVSLGKAVLTVGDGNLFEGDSGTAPARFRVTLSCPQPAPVAVSYLTRAATAAEGADYLPASGTLTLAPGETEGTIEVPVVGDVSDEDDEDYFLDINGPSGVVTLRHSARGRILDDDGPASLSVDDAAVTEGDAGTVDVLITIRLSAPSGREVRADYTTQGGTASAATAGSDYQTVSGRATFPAGATEVVVAVPILGDHIDEGLEAFRLRLSNPVNATIGDPEGEARILENDEAALSVSDVAVKEGDSGTIAATFAVTLSVPATRQIRVDWATADVTTTAGTDYVAASGSLTFAPGETSKTATVQVKGDLTNEPEERFVLRLSNPVAAVLARPEGLGTILNDEGSLIRIESKAVREAATGAVTLQLRATLTKTNAQTITVQYATTDGTAAGGADYQPASGTFTFLPGTSQQTVNLTILDDLAAEPLETFSVVLSNPVNAGLETAQGVVSVIDNDTWILLDLANDTVRPGCIRFTDGNNGQRGVAWYNQKIDLSRSFDKTFRVYLGTNDRNADGIAFVLQNASTGTSAIGQSGGYLAYKGIAPSIAVELDTFENDGQIFGDTFKFDDPGEDHVAVDENGALDHKGHPAVALPNLEDGFEHVLRVVWNAPARTLDVHVDGVERLMYGKDLIAQIFGGAASVNWGLMGASGDGGNEQYFCETAACGGSERPVISIGDARVTDGSSGTVDASLPVTLACAAGHEVRVEYATADGSAVSGADYLPVSGTLVFQPGETSKAVAVAVVGDGLGESTEQLYLDLMRPVGGEVRYARGVATILSNVAVQVANITATEGSAAPIPKALVELKLLGPAAVPVSLSYATANGTATAGSDYVAVSGTVTFQPGEVRKTIALQFVGDAVKEVDEQFVLNLINTANGDLSSAQVTVTLLDDDDCPAGNLLRNGDAEEALVGGEIPGWQEADGTSWSTSTAITPLQNLYFFPGKVPTAELRQDVDVSGFAQVIDEGQQLFAFSAWVQALPNPDTARVRVEYRDAANAQVLAAYDTGNVSTVTTWTRFSDRRAAPAGTRFIRVRLMGERTGTDEFLNTDYDAIHLVPLRTPALTIGDRKDKEGNGGSKQFVFPVTLSCPSPRRTTFDFATLDGTATAGSDYQPAAGTFTLEAGITSGSIAVAVLGDTAFETNETFTVNLINPVGLAIADGQGVGTIEQDEVTVSIGDASVIEGNSGMAVLKLPVFLTSASDQEIRVDYTTEDGTATEGVDYVPATGTLVFPAGSTATQHIQVTVLGDIAPESDETVLVKLLNPARVTILDGEGAGTILEDEISISVGDAIVLEGGTGSTVQALFIVTLSKPSSNNVQISYASRDGSATAPADYNAVSSSTSITAGQTSAILQVQVKGDAALESSEVFSLVLTSATNAHIADGEGTGFITDDDDCPSPNLIRNPGADDELNVLGDVPSWTEALGSEWKRSGGESAFQGNGLFTYRGTGSEAELRQDVDLSGWAAFIDSGLQRFLFQGYVRTSVEAVPDSARIRIELLDAGSNVLDAFDSGEMTLSGWQPVVDFRLPPVGTRTARVRLIVRALGTPDNLPDGFFDSLSLRSLGTPALQISDASLIEGHAGLSPLTFTVSMTCPAAGDVTMQYATVPGHATEGVDYEPVSGTITIPAGQLSATKTVQVVGDGKSERDETLFLDLQNAVGAALFDARGQGTIRDDDRPASISITGTIRDFKAAHPDFEESSLTKDLGIVLPLLGPDKKPVYAGKDGNPTTSGQANFDQWFRDVPGVNQGKPLSLPLQPRVDDQRVFRYSNRQFYPINGELLGNDGRNENNHFTVEAHTTFLYEGGEVLRFFSDDDMWVFLNGVLALDMGGCTCTEMAIDVDAIAATLGLSPGNAYDLDIFYAERHTGGATFQIETTMGITNRYPGALQFAAPAYDVAEDGGIATIAVTRAGGADGEVSVTYSTADGTATTPADYGAVSETLTFRNGELGPKTFTVPIVNDRDVEDTETVLLGLSAPTGGATLGTNATAVLSILNDDVRPELTASKAATLLADPDEDDVPSPGDTLRYEIVIRNSGGSPATEVVLTDQVPEHTTLVDGSVKTTRGTIDLSTLVRVEIGEVAPGESITVLFEVVIDSPVAASVKEIRNQGTVTSFELPSVLTDAPVPSGTSDPTVTPITAVPVLLAEKTWTLDVDADGDRQPSPGDTLKYEIKVLNRGNAEATSVVLTDKAPDSTEIVAGSVQTTQGTIETEDPVRVGLGGIAGGGASATVSFLVTIDNPIALGVTALTNQGEVTADGLSLKTNDPAVGGAESPTITPIVSAPKLAAEKRAILQVDEDGDGVVSPGDVLLYQISVANTGNTTATGVVLADPIPAATRIEAGSIQTSHGTVLSEDPVEISLGEVKPGEPATVSFLVRIDSTLPPDLTSVSNQATVTGAGLETRTDNPDTQEPNDPTSTEVVLRPEISIADLSVDEGAGIATFTVMLSKASNREVAVDYTTSEATALSGQDYRTASGTLSIPAGSTSGTFEVELIDDPMDELDETFAVNLSSPSGGELIDADAVAAIVDNDAPPTLSIANATVTEGAEAVFTIQLSTPSALTVSATYGTADGTALAGIDYTPASGTLTFPPGATTLTVAVPILGDLLDEADESFRLVLSPGPSATGTILDDDEARISIRDVTVGEGHSGTTEAVFRVLLSSPSDREVRVDYAILARTATEGDDYQAVSETLAFPAGETEKIVTVPVLGDLILEADETFEVVLSNPVEAAIEDGQGLGTITNDELCPSPNLVANPGAEARPVEGEIPGWAELQASEWQRRSTPPAPFEGAYMFSAGTAQEAELYQDVDVSAYADRIDAAVQRFAFSARVRSLAETPPDTVQVVVEYRDASNTVVLGAFDSGEIASTFGWTEVSDVRTAPADTRWIRVRLIAGRFTEGSNDALFDAVSLTSLGTAVVTVDGATVYEGDAGTRDALFGVRLSCRVDRDVTIGYSTADGEAVAGEDYVAVSGSLTLPAGTVQGQIPVPVLADSADEPHETFVLNLGLSNPSEAALLDPQALGTILEDDFCQRSPGYWKTHREVWPVAELRIGGVWYGDVQILAFLGYNGSDATIRLAHHLAAAKLNLARGSDPAIVPVVEQADAFLAANPPGSDPKGALRDQANSLKNTLDAYNNACPNH